MNNPLAFSHTGPFRTSSASTPFSNSPRKRCERKRPRRRCVPIIVAALPPPKPGYYKNPSRAIEKGGGFYVPGLQGPRLRFFVPTVATVFLGLNHAAAGASTNAMTRSEALAVIAAVAVFATAIFDTLKQLKPSSDNVRPHSYTSPAVSDEVSATFEIEEESNAVQWATAVATDLTSATEIAHFRKSELIYTTPEIVPSPPGVAVERVGKEGRPLYIAKSSTLPEEVKLSFLGDGDWSVFMIPTKVDDVVVFASREELSKDNRRWLEIISERIVE